MRHRRKTMGLEWVRQVFISAMRRVWQRFDLLRQFLFIASAVFLLGMALVGMALSQRIEQGVVHNTAAATALYFESFIAPLTQELAISDELPAAKRERLEALIHDTALTKRVVAFKIWLKDGRIVYASNPALIGKVFPQTESLRRAWNGEVAASLDDPRDQVQSHEPGHKIPLLEIYAPIRQEHSQRIIAVAEFYENAEKLMSDIAAAKLESWVMIGGLALVAIAALYGVVSRGSRTITSQRQALQERIEQLSVLLAHNEQLGRQVQLSSQRAAEINENYLRRFGAELHDGPAQLIGLALLRLDAVAEPAPKLSSAPDDIGSRPSAGTTGHVEWIRMILGEALNEIRNLSAGLSLPELKAMSLETIIKTAARAHRQRTGTAVSLDLGLSDRPVHHPIKTAIYRLVQEGLNNATRHAGAKGQHVRAHWDGDVIVVEVLDAGPGFDHSVERCDRHLGLAGIEERMRSLGGTLEICSGNGQIGTRIVARIPAV